jgi:hypothetical protein
VGGGVRGRRAPCLLVSIHLHCLEGLFKIATVKLPQQVIVRNQPIPLCKGYSGQYLQCVWTQCKVATVRGSDHPRGMPLVTRMQELQSRMHGNKWHPRVYIYAEKRAPCPSYTLTAWLLGRGLADREGRAPCPGQRLLRSHVWRAKEFGLPVAFRVTYICITVEQGHPQLMILDHTYGSASTPTTS